MRHPQRILILGAYGTGNLGDELILDSLVSLLSAAYPGCECRVLSQDPATSTRLHSVAAAEIPPYVTPRGGLSALLRGRWGWFADIRESRRALDAQIEWCDLFVLGGGNLLTDHPYYFLEHFAGQIARRAAEAGKAVAVLGTGFGPINTQKGQRLLEELAGWTSAAALREPSGAEAFSRAGFSNPRVSGDPVLLELPFADQVVTEPAVRAVISLRSFGNDTAVPAHVGRAVEAVGERIKLVGLAMDPELDGPVLRAQLGESAVLDAQTPARIVAEVRHSSLVLGMRLHACIVAAACGVPLIPVAYHHKVAAFATSLELEALPGEAPVSGLDVDAFVARTVEALDSRRLELVARVQILRRTGRLEFAAALGALPFDPPEPLEA